MPTGYEGALRQSLIEEEPSAETGGAENALDGQPAIIWHTAHSKTKPAHPRRLVLNLGASVALGGVRYLPAGTSPPLPAGQGPVASTSASARSGLPPQNELPIAQ